MAPPPKPGTITVTMLRGLLNDLTEARIQQLVAAGHIPKPEVKGQYDLAGCVRGYIAFLQKGGEGKKSDHTMRYERARADAMELRRDAMAGRQVPIEPVEEAWGQILGTFRQRALVIPSKCAARWSSAKTPQAAEAILDAEVRQALMEISNANITITPLIAAPDDSADGKRGAKDSSATTEDIDE